MTNDLRPRLADCCVAALLLCSFSFAVFGAWRVHERGGDSFRIGDWLINYSGGFVRRGAYGALLHALPWVRAHALEAVLVLQLSLYAALLLFAWLLFRRAERWRERLWLVISPAGFLYEGLTGSFRKELVPLVGLAAFAWAAERTSANLHRQLAVLLALFPIFTLGHELSILTLPYLLLLAVTLRPELRLTSPLLIGLLALNVAVWFTTVRFKGDLATVDTIRASWRESVPGSCLESSRGGGGAIGHLGLSAWHGLTDVARRLEGRSYLWLYARALALAMVPLWMGRRSLAMLVRSRRALVLALVGPAATLGLMAIAVDWGRFIYINFCALALVLLAAPAPAAESSRRPRIGVLLAGAMLLYAVGWSLPISRGSLARGMLAQVVQLVRAG